MDNNPVCVGVCLLAVEVLPRFPVKVCVNANDEVSIWYKEQQLEYSLYHPQTQQAPVVLAKDLDRTLALHTPVKPAPNHPWRKGFATPLSKNKNVPAARGGDIPTLLNR